MIPNVLISISGLPKTGKTYLSQTFPEPIKIYCFDGRSGHVRDKNFPDKKIDIENFVMPIIESDDDTEWAPKVWDDFYNKYKADVQSGKYQTLVIDTASTVTNILNQAVYEWAREEAEGRNKEKKKLAVNEYYTRNLLMKALFDLPKNAGINLVVIQYLGDKWATLPGKKMAEPTGELKIMGWAQTEAFCDVNIEMTTKVNIVEEDKKPVRKTIMVSTIKSNGFARDQSEQTFDDLTYDELMAVLFEEEE